MHHNSKTVCKKCNKFQKMDFHILSISIFFDILCSGVRTRAAGLVATKEVQFQCRVVQSLSRYFLFFTKYSQGSNLINSARI